MALSTDEPSKYDELGGHGRFPAVYMDAIKNHCTTAFCRAMPGQPCIDPDGRERKRPHGNRMVVRTGGSDVKPER